MDHIGIAGGRESQVCVRSSEASSWRRRVVRRGRSVRDWQYGRRPG